MQSTGFNARKARVLEARVARIRRKNKPVARRFTGIALALIATLACFFMLKGATLAYYGNEGFLRLTANSAPVEGASTLQFWLTGIDPVTRFIADVLSPPPGGA